MRSKKQRKEELAQREARGIKARRDLRTNLRHVSGNRRPAKPRHIGAPHLSPPPLAPLSPLDSLDSLGYQTFKGAVTPTPELHKIVRENLKHAMVIFNDNARTRVNDDLRSQVDVNVTEKLLPGIDQILSPFEQRGLTRSGFVALHSAPGCQEQAAHRDFDLECFDEGQVPVGVLVAIEPGTTLDVWPFPKGGTKRGTKKGTKKVKRHQVKLDQGDVLVFRGDCVHAGSAYRFENTRLHCYLDLKGTRLLNKTWIAKDTDIDPL